MYTIDGACMLYEYGSFFIEKLVIGLAAGVNSAMLVIIAVLIAVLIVLWWKRGLLKIYIIIEKFLLEISMWL